MASMKRLGWKQTSFHYYHSFIYKSAFTILLSSVIVSSLKISDAQLVSGFKEYVQRCRKIKEPVSGHRPSIFQSCHPIATLSTPRLWDCCFHSH